MGQSGQHSGTPIGAPGTGKRDTRNSGFDMQQRRAIMPLKSVNPRDATAPQMPEMAVEARTSHHITLLKLLPGMSVDSG